MAKKNIELSIKSTYTLMLNDEPNVHFVEIRLGSRYIGWVGVYGSSQEIPNELEDAAREFLYEVRPELKPKTELGKSDPARPLISPHS